MIRCGDRVMGNEEVTSAAACGGVQLGLRTGWGNKSWDRLCREGARTEGQAAWLDRANGVTWVSTVASGSSQDFIQSAMKSHKKVSSSSDRIRCML